MKEEQKSGLKAGVISGAIWAALVSLVGFMEVEFFYSSYVVAYNQLLATNSSGLTCSTATQCINYALELNTGTSLALGIGFGALIGVLFVWISPRFLTKQSYATRGTIVSLFFWLLYQLGIVSSITGIELLTSLAISILAGYLLGTLYTNFMGYSHLTQPDIDTNASMSPPNDHKSEQNQSR